MTFAHPHMLWLLLVVPPSMLAFFWWAARRRHQLQMQFIQSRLLPDLTIGVSRESEQLRAVLLLGAAAALITALAGPRWGFTLENTRQLGLDVIVAIDTSKSMLAEDIAPNRLARAKLAAIDLMQTAKSDRLGLVAFAGTAFLQCPLTIDDAAFRQSVDILDVDTLPQGGTAVAEAIATAQAQSKRLARPPRMACAYSPSASDLPRESCCGCAMPRGGQITSGTTRATW
jgi:Ca-activated chloride channel family protein